MAPAVTPVAQRHKDGTRGVWAAISSLLHCFGPAPGNGRPPAKQHCGLSDGPPGGNSNGPRDVTRREAAFVSQPESGPGLVLAVNVLTQNSAGTRKGTAVEALDGTERLTVQLHGSTAALQPLWAKQQPTALHAPGLAEAMRLLVQLTQHNEELEGLLEEAAMCALCGQSCKVYCDVAPGLRFDSGSTVERVEVKSCCLSLPGSKPCKVAGLIISMKQAQEQLQAPLSRLQLLPSNSDKALEAKVALPTPHGLHWLALSLAANALPTGSMAILCSRDKELLSVAYANTRASAYLGLMPSEPLPHGLQPQVLLAELFAHAPETLAQVWRCLATGQGVTAIIKVPAHLDALALARFGRRSIMARGVAAASAAAASASAAAAAAEPQSMAPPSTRRSRQPSIVLHAPHPPQWGDTSSQQGFMWLDQRVCEVPDETSQQRATHSTTSAAPASLSRMPSVAFADAHEQELLERLTHDGSPTTSPHRAARRGLAMPWLHLSRTPSSSVHSLLGSSPRALSFTPGLLLGAAGQKAGSALLRQSSNVCAAVLAARTAEQEQVGVKPPPQMPTPDPASAALQQSTAAPAGDMPQNLRPFLKVRHGGFEGLPECQPAGPVDAPAQQLSVQQSTGANAAAAAAAGDMQHDASGPMPRRQLQPPAAPAVLVMQAVPLVPMPDDKSQVQKAARRRPDPCWPEHMDSRNTPAAAATATLIVDVDVDADANVDAASCASSASNDAASLAPVAATPASGGGSPWPLQPFAGLQVRTAGTVAPRSYASIAEEEGSDDGVSSGHAPQLQISGMVGSPSAAAALLRPRLLAVRFSIDEEGSHRSTAVAPSGVGRSNSQQLFSPKAAASAEPCLAHMTEPTGGLARHSSALRYCGEGCNGSCGTPSPSSARPASLTNLANRSFVRQSIDVPSSFWLQRAAATAPGVTGSLPPARSQPLRRTPSVRTRVYSLLDQLQHQTVAAAGLQRAHTRSMQLPNIVCTPRSATASGLSNSLLTTTGPGARHPPERHHAATHSTTAPGACNGAPVPPLAEQTPSGMLVRATIASSHMRHSAWAFGTATSKSSGEHVTQASSGSVGGFPLGLCIAVQASPAPTTAQLSLTLPDLAGISGVNGDARNEPAPAAAPAAPTDSALSRLSQPESVGHNSCVGNVTLHLDGMCLAASPRGHSAAASAAAALSREAVGGNAAGTEAARCTSAGGEETRPCAVARGSHPPGSMAAKATRPCQQQHQPCVEEEEEDTVTSLPLSPSAVGPLAWHRVSLAVTDAPKSCGAGPGGKLLHVFLEDVSGQVQEERCMAALLEYEHKIIEQLFPRHIVEYLAAGLGHTRDGMHADEPTVTTTAHSSIATRSSAFCEPSVGPLGKRPSSLTTGSGAPLSAGPGRPRVGWGRGPGHPYSMANSSSAHASGAHAGSGLYGPSTNAGSASRTGQPMALMQRLRLEREQEVRKVASLATAHQMTTVLFSDIIGFTSMCKQISPLQVMQFLNEFYQQLDAMLEVYKVYKVETIGDCYVVCGGLMRYDEDGYRSVLPEGETDELHAVRVLAFAKAMLRVSRTVRSPVTGEPIQIRIGVHSGPVVSGMVGAAGRQPRFCLFGCTVEKAHKLESKGQPGRIHVSATTHALLPSEPWDRTDPPATAEGDDLTSGPTYHLVERTEATHMHWRHVSGVYL